MRGANDPRSTMMPRTTAATRDVRLRRIRRTMSASGDSRGRAALVRAESWIGPGIKHVGEKTAQRHHDAADDHRADYQWIVAGTDAVDESVAHPGPGKNLFDEDGAGQQGGERQSE